MTEAEEDEEDDEQQMWEFFYFKIFMLWFFQIWRRRLRLMQKLAYSVEYHLFIIFIWIFFLLFFVQRDDDLIEAVEMDMDDNANDVDRDQKIDFMVNRSTESTAIFSLVS